MNARSIAFAVLSAVVVAALWYAFKPPAAAPQPRDEAGARQDAAAAVTGALASAPAPTASAAPSAGKVFDLVVKDGRLVSGPALMQVHEGDPVTLTIRSDRADELHLHGYDLHQRIVPGQAVSLSFSASRSGRFGLELHKANVELGALEVYPR